MLVGVARIVLTVVLGLAAVGVALVVQRRQGPAAPVRTAYSVPDHLDRADFPRPEAPWLVVVFTSATAAQRSVAVTGPTKLAATTPSWSTTTVVGTASMR